MTKQSTKVTEVTTEQQITEMVTKLNALPSTSARMRSLVSELGSVKAAHKWLNANYKRPDGKEWRYQHVRNVINQKLKSA